MLTDLEPGSDPRLAAVIAAAKAPAELPVPGERAALAAYRRSDGRSWFTLRLPVRSARMVAAALVGSLVVAGGVATAATGSLPVVGGHSHHGTHATGARSTSATDGTGAVGADGVPQAGNSGTGATDLTDTGGPGTPGHPGVLGSVQKGIDTCTQASQGQCQAGQHGKALQAHTHRSGTPSPAGTAHPTSHPGSRSAPGLARAALHRHLPPGRDIASVRPAHRQG